MEPELIEILQSTRSEGGGDKGDYLTTRDIMRRTGWHRDKVLLSLRELDDMGLLSVRKVVRGNIAGGTNKVPGYKVKGDGDVTHDHD